MSKKKKPTLEELRNALSALSLRLEELENVISEKDREIAKLKEELDEPEQLTEKVPQAEKKSPIDELTAGELLVLAQKHGIPWRDSSD